MATDNSTVANQVFIQDGVEIASYFPLSNNLAKKQVIFFDNGKVHLRRFGSIALSTMTAVAYLEGKIFNMDSLYNTLACHPEVSNENLKNLPPGTLVSVCWGCKCKGKKIGIFPHGICTSIWNGTKEIKCKIFKKTKQRGDKDSDAVKFQLTGVDENVGYIVANMVAKQMCESAYFYNYICNNIKDYEETIIGLIKSTHGPIVEIRKKNDDIYGTDSIVKDQHIGWPQPQFIPDKYLNLAIGIIQRCTDLRYSSEILPRAKQILENGPPCDMNMTVYSVKRAMSKYNYNLGFKVNRLELTKFLIEIGYAACFFNEIVEYVFVPVSDELVDSEGTVRREPGRDNQFEIFETGKIKHAGTGSIPTENTYICLMLDIIRGVDRFAIFNEADKYNRDSSDVF